MFGKIKGKKQPPCEKQGCAALCRSTACLTMPTWWLMNLSTSLAQSSCKRHQEMLSSKQEKSPSVEQQPSVLVFLFLKVICFSLGKHSHSVYYTESKCICPCGPSIPLTATQLLRKCPDISPARFYEISCVLLLLATVFHVRWCCLSGCTFPQAGVLFFHLPLTG